MIYCKVDFCKKTEYANIKHRGASRGEGGIHPLPSKRKVSLKRPSAPKMSNEGLKWPKMPCLRTHIPCPALILDAPLIFFIEILLGTGLQSSSQSGASRMRAGQGICVLRQGILCHFRPLLDIFRAKGLFKDTFLFEGRGCITPLPP